MIKINLLPGDRKSSKLPDTGLSKPSVSFDWAKDISLYIGIGAGVLLFVVLLIIHIVQGNTISSIKNDINVKNKELAKLQTEVKMVEELKKQKTIFEQRLNAIKVLVGDRVFPVHLWAEVNNALPKFVWLTGLKQNGNNITLKGKAFTKIQISELYNRLSNSPYFTNVKINEIKTVKDNNQSVDEFTIVMNTQLPNTSNK